MAVPAAAAAGTARAAAEAMVGRAAGALGGACPSARSRIASGTRSSSCCTSSRRQCGSPWCQRKAHRSRMPWRNCSAAPRSCIPCCHRSSASSASVTAPGSVTASAGRRPPPRRRSSHTSAHIRCRTRQTLDQSQSRRRTAVLEPMRHEARSQRPRLPTLSRPWALSEVCMRCVRWLAPGPWRPGRARIPKWNRLFVKNSSIITAHANTRDPECYTAPDAAPPGDVYSLISLCCSSLRVGGAGSTRDASAHYFLGRPGPRFFWMPTR